MLTSYLLCLLNVDIFRCFYQKVQLLPIPYEAANSNQVILLLTAQDDFVRHIYQAPLAFSPVVRCFISTMILLPLENAVHEVCYITGEKVQVTIMRNNCDNHKLSVFIALIAQKKYCTMKLMNRDYNITFVSRY